MKRLNWNTLRRTQRTVLKRVTKAYRTTSSEALQVIANAPPIDLEILRKTLHLCIYGRFRERTLTADQNPRPLVKNPIELDPEAKILIAEYVRAEWQNRWAQTT